ncbi:MAG: sugar isomerase [Planctomycetes bacterium]|nr:sugar isomerase [Planctomycetota bacterium]
MNPAQSHYNRFGLVRDMMQTPEIIAGYDTGLAVDTARRIAEVGRLMLTGEGSSRIFPAKHAIMQARRAGWPIALHTEAARQAQEYDLGGWAVFAASNSGKTSEVIKLFHDLRAKGHRDCFGLTATPSSKLEEVAATTYVLGCGKEGAVAATKSVVEQALFYHALVERIAGADALRGALKELGSHCRDALTAAIDPVITAKIAKAGTIYFAGRNDGVAEELTLKTNEITRKKSDFLEGTYAAHGIEEVMNADDVVIWIDPYDDSQQKFTEVLVKGVGMTVIAVSSRATPFPTIRVPESRFPSYVGMCAGWNLLVEAGIQLGIDLDKPQRARKVGNEWIPT